MKRTLMLLAVVLVAGCSNRALYENVQHNQRLECSKRPPSEYDPCMESSSKSYEEYRRERQEVVDE